MTGIALATEDELSEAVGKRLLVDAGCVILPSPLLRKGGSGYLRSRMDSWCQMANRKPVLLITDLDNVECPPTLLQNWMGANALPENLIFRIAVREVESWLLADHEAMRLLIGKRGTLPPDPDSLIDPKQHFLRLISRLASREIRYDLIAQKGAIASQGLAYNARLTEFIANKWVPERAARRSNSLHRARIAVHGLMRRLSE